MFEAECTTSRGRRAPVVGCVACLGLLASFLFAPTQIAAAGLPSVVRSIPAPVAVTVPTAPVPVKAPASPVKAPALPVKAPSVPVKPPSVLAKPPSVPVKVPTLPGAPTPVPVKAPAPPVKVPSAPAQGGPYAAAPGKPAFPQPAGTPSAASGSGRGPAGSYPASPLPPSRSAPPAEFLWLGASSAHLPAAPGAASKPGQAVPRGTARRRARFASTKTLQAELHRFSGCLAFLPVLSREALELRAGLGAGPPLTPMAVASLLHLSLKRYGTLERGALAHLRLTARTRGCDGLAQALGSSPSESPFLTLGDAGAALLATRGVAAASYRKAPSDASKSTQPSTDQGLFGGSVGPRAGSAGLGTIVLLMAGAFVIALLVADGLGVGPRNAAWRRRWSQRFKGRR